MSPVVPEEPFLAACSVTELGSMRDQCTSEHAMHAAMQHHGVIPACLAACVTLTHNFPRAPA